MILRLLISLELLLLATLAARAQTAEEFFNGGAQFYISNSIPSALEKVEGGRKLYPEDVKLKKLEELLKQQQQQQQQQQQKNNQQQSQNQQKQQDQQAQNQSGQQNDKQKQEQQQAKTAGKQTNEKQDGQTKQAQAAAAQEMSSEQAQRLLDAQKGDEQFLQLKPKNPPESPNRPIKDW
jgi:Ca-activated chloride channel family protein